MKTCTLLGIITIFLSGFVLSSCDAVMGPCPNKDKFLSSFEEMIVAYKDHSAPTEEDKATYDTQYRTLVNDCYKKYKPELTLKERQDFWVKSLKFFINRYDGDLEIKFKDKLDDPFNAYVKDEVVALVKESGFSFVMSLQDIFKDDLPKLMDTFSDELKNIGQEFMENLFSK